jgi:hypothetical protein
VFKISAAVYYLVPEFSNWQVENFSLDEVEAMDRQAGTDSKLIKNTGHINQHFGIKSPESGNNEALNNLLQRPWFSRAWTFQESWLAQTRRFICGTREVSADNLLWAVQALYHLNSVEDDPRYNIMGALYVIEGRNFWTRRSQTMGTLLELLLIREGSGCKYPHDLIYSLLGSVRDDLGIKASYSTRWQGVFADFTYKQIVKSGSLSILGQVDAENQSADRPSWVPNWRASRVNNEHRRFTDCVQVAKTGARMYAACGFSPPKTSLAVASLRLTLFGFELDTVTSAIRCHQDRDQAIPWSKKQPILGRRWSIPTNFGAQGPSDVQNNLC